MDPFSQGAMRTVTALQSNQLRNVQQVQATGGAFEDRLRKVQQVHATAGAFAAVLEDGSVVTWGGQGFGRESSAVEHEFAYI